MTNQIVQKIRAHRIPLARPLPNGGFKMTEGEAIDVIDKYVEEMATQTRDAIDKSIILQEENRTLRQQLATLIEQGKQPAAKQDNQAEEPKQE